MKYLIYILLFIFFSQVNAQSYSLEQGREDFQRSRNALSQPVPAHIQKHFDDAINEIDQMLKGEKTLSFKRSVYLVENAYYEGKISWKEYNNEILRIKPILDKMIKTGLKGYNDLIDYPELMREFEIMNATFKYLSEIGYSTMKNEDYEKMVIDVKEKQAKVNLGK